MNEASSKVCSMVKTFAAFLFIIVCAISSYLVVKLSVLPNEIHILAGHESRVALDGPFTASFYTESVAAVSVNSKPVVDNIKIDLNDGLSINSQAPGQMDMSLNLFGVKVKSVSVDILPDTKVIPCGMAAGVDFHTEGIMVLGTGQVVSMDGTVKRPSENLLKSGDIILEAGGQPLDSGVSLAKRVEAAKDGEKIDLKVKREDELLNVSIPAVKDKETGVNKLAVWVRDSTQGIGTVTYYNPKTGFFGALGHGILDVDTKKLLTVKDGKLLKARIVNIRKAKKGAPGELCGEINKNEKIGDIQLNTAMGLYGSMDSAKAGLSGAEVEIALQPDIHEGPAKIRSHVDGTEARDYDVYIESVNRRSADEAKSMVVRVTDPDLIAKTNGIVQGMSGSPIIQDGKLVGAITHVFVQNPLKGYGIFIEHMLKQEKNINL